jgi:putative transposase
MCDVLHGAVRVRLEVSDADEAVLLRAAGARRFAFNWAVAKIQANHDEWAAQRDAGVPPEERVRPLSFFTLAKQWTAEKAEVAPWAGEHSTWTFRYAIRSAAEAHRAFLEGKRRFPRFKARHRDRARFTVTDGLHLEPGRVRVAKYGWFRISAPCRAQARLRRLVRRGRARLMNVTVARHSDGRWYATVCFERHESATSPLWMAPTGPVVGVDRGVKVNAVAATASREVKAELPGLRSLRDAHRRVAHLQRNFARTRKGSANRRKAAARLARAHARVAAIRGDALHTFSARLAREHPVVVIEDLAVSHLLRNHHLAAAIADQGWAELARQLAYKTVRHGGQVVVVDRFFASSKTCSCCGWVKPKLSLADRTYRCDNPDCRLVADRDVNAAANLAAWGATHLGLNQDGDRHPGGPTAGACRHACGGSNEPPPISVAAGAPDEPGTSQPFNRVA